MKNIVKISIIAISALLIGAQTMNAETKRALLVGISDYGNAMEDPNKWANISGANDVELNPKSWTKESLKNVRQSKKKVCQA